MNAVELEKMVVRLLGDGSSYVNMLNTSTAETIHAADQVEKQASRIEGFSASLKGYASSALSALASIGAGEMLHKAFEAFEGKEVGMVKLSASLKANGRDVDALTKQYGEFAKAQAEVSLTTEDETRDMLRRAEAFGLTGEAAQKAVSDAINIGAAADVSAEGIMRITVALAQGDVQRAMMFSRMVPQLRSVRNETEFLEKAQRLVNQGLEQNVQMTKTAEGTIHHLSTAYKMLLQDFGKVVADGVKPYVEGLEEIVNWVRKLSPATKEIIIVTLGVVAVLLMIPPALALISFWMSMATGGTLPLLGLIAAVVIGAVAMTESFGGVATVFKSIKSKAEAAWEWLTPVRRELKVLWNDITEFATVAWAWVEQFAINTWRMIFGEAQVDWEKIKLFILSALIAGEYGLKNFGKLWELSMKLAGDTTQAVIDQTVYSFTVRGPAAAKAYYEAFRSMFQQVLDIATAVFLKMGRYGEALYTILFDRNRFHIRDAVKSITREMMDTSILDMAKNFKVPAINLPPAMLPGLVEKIRKEWQDAGEMVGGDFTTFLAKRLKELGVPEKTEEAKKSGKATGDAYNKGVKGEVEKLDAQLRGSTEALARISAYREQLAGDVVKGGHRAESKSGANLMPNMNVDSTDVASADAVPVLKDILKELQDGNKKPDVNLNPANIG